jgi:hypothetical protein
MYVIDDITLPPIGDAALGAIAGLVSASCGVKKAGALAHPAARRRFFVLKRRIIDITIQMG